MRIRACHSVFMVTVLSLVPLQSFAQGVDVGISGVGLVSIQPVDDYYVGGPYLNESLCHTHTSRLHDALLSGMVGYAKSAGSTRVLFLGGIGVILDSPTIDGVEQTIYDIGDQSAPATVRNHLLALTGGLDVLRTLGSRGALVISERYSHVERYGLSYLGIGPHVFRIGVGIRVRIN